MHNPAVVSVSLLVDSAAAVQGMSPDVTAAAGSGDMSLEVKKQDNLVAAVNSLHRHHNNIIS